VRVTAQGWKVDGIHEDGLADADIVLTRVREAAEASSSA
jgi:hypothetical protein